MVYIVPAALGFPLLSKKLIGNPYVFGAHSKVVDPGFEIVPPGLVPQNKF